MCAIHCEQTTYGPPSVREQETVRIDVVAYNRKRRMMLSDAGVIRDCLLDRNEFHHALYRGNPLGSCFPL